MNILDTIIARKKEEVAIRKATVSLDQLEKSQLYTRPTLSLAASLVHPQRTGIIAEYKRKSPSKGIINANAQVADVTRAYTQFGASGLSVLTDEHFFGGSSDDLLAARENNIPILRKDFIIDEYQIAEARAIGADVILLIAANLTTVQVQQLAAYAKSLQLEVLLEIHDETELDHICDEVDMVGVNNRNLKTFEVDINTSLRLISRMPAHKPGVAESGISSPETIKTLRQAGFKGFLIGENFMKQPDPSVAFADFVKQL
ncbi:indole-3-glycerol phosphate synthase [Filimonas lacunae]|uniref:Indole-3-glycerol phosphate synthase n=1 Tax=Filimonas lacunae TaxID=477680 RepID=A0A173ML79_9BACT|nr:indole-3-glycerol phosphate synthase TrpC [Filimonas lacunae]BAV08158.1 indole-3-glycerol phosphate synthase [Filimonas lacunae]SIT10117.1 indole-3-glycerol phosphate synthase [Filimonas lacunae]